MAVLVLNQNYEPLAVARVPRALALVGDGKAEVLAHGSAPIRTASAALPRPAVIRLVAYVRRPRPSVRYSRQAVFRRDGYACQYCGARPRDLTLDHVLPRHRGGPDTWENVVAACRRCNGKKGGRTPAEARMRLRSEPRAPRATASALLGLHDEVREAWRPYVAWTDTPPWRLE